MQRLSLLLAAVVLCAVLLVAGCGDNKQPNPAVSAPPPAVTVVKVTAAEIKPAKTFTGRIEAKDKVDLRVRVDGFLEKRLFTEGADVKEGELLFVIEKGLYQAAVDQAKAGLETAQATLKLADIDVDRQTQLMQRNVTAQATLDQSTARQGEARGNMLAQQAALEKAELQLSYTDIKSPISGRIGRSSVSVGNFVSPSNSALATIVSQDPIYASFPVTQREMLVLVDGQLVTVVAEEGKGESALLVPQQALQVDQTGPYVLVVDKDNKIQIRRVETDVARGVNIVIRKGLAANELIVAEGIQRVRPGQVVAPTEAKPGA